MTDNLSQLSTEVGLTAAPTDEQLRRAGLAAADYALTQADPAGALAELVAALDLVGRGPIGRRCPVCKKPLAPAAKIGRARYCSRRCSAARKAAPDGR